MATQYDPIAKDASLNTTESPSRNLADVIAQSLASLIAAMPATVLNNLADVVITLPTDGQTLKYDSVSQKWVNADDAGGHTIIDPDGQDMTQRAGMQFVDLHLSDDGVNDKTVVEAFEVLADESDFDDLDETDAENDGAYLFENDGVPLTADMVGYGAGTVEDALDYVATCARVFRFGLSNGVTYTLTTAAQPHLAMLVGSGNRGGIWFFGNGVCTQLWGEGESRFAMTRISATEFTVKQTANSIVALVVLSVTQDEIITIAENT